MRIAYLPGKAKTPQPSLAGSLVRHRPIMAIRIAGPRGSWILDGLLDSGSDDTIFPEWIASVIGVVLSLAGAQDLHLAGRGTPLQCRYLPVTLRITDGKQETYEWNPIVGFVAIPLRCPLLGQAGFLHYFDVSLRGADRWADISPNWAFPGHRI